jgi:hypothetical protein
MVLDAVQDVQARCVVYLTPSIFSLLFFNTIVSQGTCVHCQFSRNFSLLNYTSTMAPKTRSAKEVEEAALDLMRMADPDWNSPDADEKENESHDINQETPDQRTEHAKTLLSFSQAAVIHSTRSQSLSVTQSQSVPATPPQSVSGTSSQTALTTPSQTVSAAASQAASANPSQRNSTTNNSSSNSASATTPSLTAASLAVLTVEQRALQQRRFAMTSQERAAHDLKAYTHYDLNNNQIGILWQTKNENRTYRQTQRRNGAARLRAGTTTGLKFPRRRRRA